MDYEYDKRTDSYTCSDEDTGEHEMKTPYETNSVIQNTYDRRFFLVLGHIWWNCEQTFAYYLIQCDAEGNVLDGCNPTYEWCHDSCTVVKAPAIPDAA